MLEKRTDYDWERFEVKRGFDNKIANRVEINRELISPVIKKNELA